MTKAVIAAQIKHAKALINAGRCAEAQQIVAQAWHSIGQYAQYLAINRFSQSAAKSLQKDLSKVLVLASRRCPETIAPSGQSVVNPDLLRPSGQQSTLNPDLLRPSFSGTGDDIANRLTTTLTTLGIAGAVFGLAYGFWTIYKAH